jgi:hypothetical protein
MVVPAFDGRPLFVETKTGKAHERAYVVFGGTSVTPEEAFSKLRDAPPDRDDALRQLGSFIEQVAQFKLGNVLTVERGAEGLPLLRKVAEHPARKPGQSFPCDGRPAGDITRQCTDRAGGIVSVGRAQVGAGPAGDRPTFFSGRQMSDFDYMKTIGKMCEVINAGRPIADSMSSLLDFCESEASSEAALWKDLRGRDYAGDAKAMQQAFGASLRVNAVPPEYSGLYFGLDGLNMPRSKGIEFGCSKTLMKRTTTAA